MDRTGHEKVVLRPTVAAILAGGASRRMGRDKASVLLEGRTMLARVCSAATAAALPVMVIGREESGAEQLPGNIAFLPDATPALGPLGGLVTALRHAPPESDLILAACDLPFVSAGEFHWLRTEAASAQELDGVVPLHGGRPQPLFAVYRPSCLPSAENLLRDGRRAMLDLLQAGRFRLVPLPEQHAAATRDIDTPQQLAETVQGASLLRRTGEPQDETFAQENGGGGGA